MSGYDVTMIRPAVTRTTLDHTLQFELSHISISSPPGFYYFGNATPRIT